MMEMSHRAAFRQQFLQRSAQTPCRSEKGKLHQQGKYGEQKRELAIENLSPTPPIHRINSNVVPINPNKNHRVLIVKRSANNNLVGKRIVVTFFRLDRHRKAVFSAHVCIFGHSRFQPRHFPARHWSMPRPVPTAHGTFRIPQSPCFRVFGMRPYGKHRCSRSRSAQWDP